MHPKKVVLADHGFIVKRSLVTLPVRTSSYTGYHDRLMNMLLKYMYMQDPFTVICLPRHLQVKNNNNNFPLSCFAL